MSILDKLKRMIFEEKNVPASIGSGNVLLMDAGASSVKFDFNNTKGTYKASIREIEEAEKGTQGNVICVNSKWFSIGDRETETSMEILKHEKENIENVILYSLAKYHNDIQENKLYEINMFLLLPENQLTYIDEWRSKFIDKVFTVTPNLGITRNYKINLIEVLPEGGMARFNIDDRLLKNTVDVIMSDWGYSTIDNCPFWGKDMIMQKGTPVNRGMRNLMVRHNFYIKEDTPELLSVFYRSGKYKVNKNLKRFIKKENYKFIDSVAKEMKLSILGQANPFDTSIVFFGGGSNLLRDDLIEYFNNNEKYKHFNLIFLSGEESVYANILGMKKYVEKFFLGKEEKGSHGESKGESANEELGNNNIGNSFIGKEAETLPSNDIVPIADIETGKQEGLPKEEIPEHRKFEIIKNEEMETEALDSDRKGNSDNIDIKDSETYINIVEEIGNGNLTDDRKVELIYILESMHKKQKEIAMLFDVSTKTIRNWKNNKKLSIIK